MPKNEPIRSSVRRKIRVRKEDAAYVYFILESHEGITSYSTLPSGPGDGFRDLEIRTPGGFVDEVAALLLRLRGEGIEILPADPEGEELG